MSNLTKFAESELTRAGFFDKDSDYGGMLGEAVMKMVKVFADEGHSGFSAGMAISLFKTVASFEPLTPLTGDDDEWMKSRKALFRTSDARMSSRKAGKPTISTGASFEIQMGLASPTVTAAFR